MVIWYTKDKQNRQVEFSTCLFYSNFVGITPTTAKGSRTHVVRLPLAIYKKGCRLIYALLLECMLCEEAREPNVSLAYQGNPYTAFV